MSYTWTKANVRPPQSLIPDLESKRDMFSLLLDKLKQADYKIVYIDETSFDIKALPLYTWSAKCEKPEKLIRSSVSNYNSIAAQWDDFVYFWVKKEPTDNLNFIRFMEDLLIQLKKKITKNHFCKRTVFVFDNAKIHKTDSVKSFFKDNDLVAFTTPVYSPELNSIEHTFGRLKKNMSRQNLNSKDFLHIIQEQIQSL